jgi:hypothetical protein
MCNILVAIDFPQANSVRKAFEYPRMRQKLVRVVILFGRSHPLEAEVAKSVDRVIHGGSLEGESLLTQHYAVN